MEEYHSSYQGKGSEQAEHERTEGAVRAAPTPKSPERDGKRDSNDRKENCVVSKEAQPRCRENTHYDGSARAAQRGTCGGNHARESRKPTDIFLHNGHKTSLSEGNAPMLVFSPSQQELAPCCIEGHRTLPYEQKTQQSRGDGRSNALQLAHSWKNTHASAGMGSRSPYPHSGQVSTDCMWIAVIPCPSVKCALLP